MRGDEETDFVVDGETNATANLVGVEEMTHADEKQVEVVDAGGLDDPVDARSQETVADLEGEEMCW